MTRVRNAFTHDKKASLFEAKQLFLLSVGLALLLKLNFSYFLQNISGIASRKKCHSIPHFQFEGEVALP